MTHLSKSPRLESIDLLRGTAVALMFATHCFRNYGDHARSEASRAAWPAIEGGFDLLMRIEPVISAAFLLLAGFSAAWARARPLPTLKRAMTLMGISSLILLFQDGLQWPALAANSGILLTIALSIMSVSLLIQLPRPQWAVLAAWVGVATWAWLLERPMLMATPPLPVLPTEHVPQLLFALEGALIALILQGLEGARLKAAAWATGVAAVASVLCLLAPGAIDYDTQLVLKDWRALRDGNAGVTSLLWAMGLLTAAPATEIGFIYQNNTVLGATRLGAIVGFALAGGIWLEGRASAALMRAQPVRWLALMGKHALFLYVAHLALLEVLNAYGLHARNAAQAAGILAAVISLGVGSTWLLSRKRRSNSRHPASSQKAADPEPLSNAA
jgi:uncharacterized membrane protein